VVLAASSMAPVFAEVEEQFLAAHPCVTDISFSYGSSATLAAQIVNGSPADVFVSASESTMNTVSDSGQAVNTTLFARNSGEIMANTASRFAKNVTSIESLSKSSNPDIKVGLCVATAPCGALADSILQKSGTTRRALADTESPSVEDLVSKIEMGELDAGIVYHSDCVYAQKNKRAICLQIPADANANNSYYVAALNTRNVTQQFVDFVSNATFTKSLQSKYGFLAP
jgi:molybdate transport system substrate-binding protein